MNPFNSIKYTEALDIIAFVFHIEPSSIRDIPDYELKKLIFLKDRMEVLGHEIQRVANERGLI